MDAPGTDPRDDAQQPQGEGQARHASPAPQKKSTWAALVKETAIILVAAFVLSWTVKTFLVQPFFIPSESMEATLVKGDRVLVSKLTPGPFDLSRGDVVVFKDPGGWLDASAPASSGLPDAVESFFTFVGLMPQDSGEHLIKRVVGLPGDHVVCCDAEGRMTVNDAPLDEEQYLRPGSIPSQVEFDVVVPSGHLWVQGDNRQGSYDSRFTGGQPGGPFVPLDNVVGVAFAKVWPADRIALMRNPGDVFDAVPEP